MDTCCLDVFALDPVTLKWVTVEVTVAMDAYSRCIVGLRVAPTTKSLDVALTLFQAFRPPAAPPDWPPHAVWPEHGIPRAIFVDVDGLEGRTCSVCHPAIVPETIIIDHGKPYKNAHINSVCHRMGMSIQPARLRTGQDKGILERFFLTLRLGLLQHLPGYKGPDVYSRGVSPETDAFLYIDELEHLIRRWIAGSYHLEPHDSLFDPNNSSHKFSPVEMYEHGLERAGFIEAPRDPDLALEFLVPVRRMIRHDGIQYNNRMYNGPGLDGLRGEESDVLGKAKRQWYIHVNPDDIVRAYFRHPVTRRWHTLYWTNAPALDLPMNEDGAKYARQLARARGTSDEPGAALAAMLDEWNLGFGMTAAERRIALRLSRERASVVGDLTTADDADAKAFVEAERAILIASKITVQQGIAADSTGEDDLDAFDDDDEDSDLDDENYYAEAFENR